MLGRLAPVLFVILWSSGFIGAKFGLPYADAFSFLLVRFLLASPIMALIAVAGGARWPRGAGIGHAVGAGLLVHATYLGGVFFAIGQGLGAAVTALIVGLQPVMTAALAGPLLGERVTWARLFGLLLGLAGIALVVGDNIAAGAAHELPPLGLLGAGLALIGITAGTVYQKRACNALDPRAVSALQYAASAVPMAAIVAIGGFRIEWSGEFVFALAWLTLALSVGAVTLLYLLLRRGEAVGVANLFNLSPPTTALLAAILFGEAITAWDVAGFACAAAGVWIAARK